MYLTIKETFPDHFFQEWSNQKASNSVNKKGFNVIEEGQPTTRLEIKALNSSDHFYIAARKLNNLDFFSNLSIILGNYVIVQADNQYFAINLNSLEERLHLSAKKIQQAIQTSTLAQLLSSPRVLLLPQVIQEYQTLVKQYELVGNWNLTHKENKDVELTKPLLMKVLRISFAIFKSPGEEPPLFRFLGIKNRKWLVHQRNQQLAIMDWRPQPPYQGLYTVIQKIWNISLSRYEIFKTAKSFQSKEDLVPLFGQQKIDAATPENMTKYLAIGNKRAQTKILHEYTLLSHIHRDGPVLGIQRRPYLFIDHKQISSENCITGFIEYGYNCNYWMLCQKRLTNRPALADYMYEFYQVLYGLNQLHQKGILHNDIKPQNILVEQRSTGNLVYIADFAGARQIPSINGQQHFNETIGIQEDTTIYISYDDYTYLKQAEEKSNWELYAATAGAMDVFATGITLYQILFNQNPYAISMYKISDSKEIKFINTTQEWDQSYLKGLEHEKELIEFFNLVLNPDLEIRGNAQKAFRLFDDFFSQHYPNLHHELKQLYNNTNQNVNNG